MPNSVRRQRHRRLAAILLLGVTVIGLTAVVDVASAGAAGPPFCFYTKDCKSPLNLYQSSGASCADGATTNRTAVLKDPTMSVSYAMVELRYASNASCRVIWARLTSTNTYIGSYGSYYLWTNRQTCAAGDTSGYNVLFVTGGIISLTMDDAGCTGTSWIRGYNGSPNGGYINTYPPF